MPWQLIVVCIALTAAAAIVVLRAVRNERKRKKSASEEMLEALAAMPHREVWPGIRAFGDLGSALVVAGLLRTEDIETIVISRPLKGGVDFEHCVFVVAEKLRRAEWVLAQLPPSDAELDFLATGRLPGTGEEK